MAFLVLPALVAFFGASLLYWSVRSDHPKEAWFWNPTWQLALGQRKMSDHDAVARDPEQEHARAA
jgi:hypothetical protein